MVAATEVALRASRVPSVAEKAFLWVDRLPEAHLSVQVGRTVASVFPPSPLIGVLRRATVLGVSLIAECVHSDRAAQDTEQPRRRLPDFFFFSSFLSLLAALIRLRAKRVELSEAVLTKRILCSWHAPWPLWRAQVFRWSESGLVRRRRLEVYASASEGVLHSAFPASHSGVFAFVATAFRVRYKRF